MSPSLRALMREAGAAFAVLSIYVLTLLVPLHQAAATQRGFAELGYETIGAWDICAAINEANGETDTPTAVNCPVTGIGKQQLALNANLPAPILVPVIAESVAYSDLSQAPPSSPINPGAHPRAPPALA